MAKLIVVVLGLVATAGALLAGYKLAYAGNSSFKVMKVDDLAKLIASGDPKLAIYDANEPSFRLKEGVLPGAKLLSSFNKYDVSKELPAAKDAKLVFYCASSL
jgi:hypothetical protein